MPKHILGWPESLRMCSMGKRRSMRRRPSSSIQNWPKHMSSWPTLPWRMTTASAEADKAIALANDALDAMAAHAALDLIADRSPNEWFAKIAAINPGYGEGYTRVARQLEMHYRYEGAVTYYRKAIEADPRLWAAHSALGIDLMRLGKEDEPLKELELSYNNDYRDGEQLTTAG